MNDRTARDLRDAARVAETMGDADSTAPLRPIRLGLIGAGYIAAYHARGILGTAGAELAWVASRGAESGRALVRSIGEGRSTTEVERVIEDPSVDAVVVATPNGLHEAHSVAALRAGKAVLVEKPLAATLEEARRIIATARTTRGHLQVGHMWRHDVEAQRIREGISEGDVGRVYRTVSYGSHERWGPAGWFVDPERAGGGALLDMGVHAIDTTRFLLNDPRPQSVYARISTEHGDYGVDDTALVVITWEGGIVSSIESGWWQPHSEGPEAATRVYGTRGFASLFPTYIERIDVSADRPDDGRYPDPARVTPTFPSRGEHCDQRIYTAQIAAFVRDVRRRHRGETDYRASGDRPAAPPVSEREMKGRSAPVPSWEPGLIAMRIADAAYRSAASDRVVSLPSEP